MGSAPADLLTGLRVAVAGNARPLRVAAHVLEGFGATVVLTQGQAPDLLDELWLGTPRAADATGGGFDIGLAEPEDLRHVPARSQIELVGTSARAANDRHRLSADEAAALGGISVAIGEPDRAPLGLPDGCVDALVGVHVAAAAVLSALRGVARSEVAAADVVAWVIATNLHLYLPYGLPWLRAGRRASGSGNCYPYALFEADDGPYCLIGRTEADWRALVRAMNNPAWADDPVFADPRSFGRHHPEMADARVAPWVARHTRDRLTEQLARNRFPGGPVLEPAEVLELPALADRWRVLPHVSGEVKTPGACCDVEPVPGGEPVELDGLVVLDLSWVWSGPAVGVALAELGANVIKVESVTRPDNSRLRGAPAGTPASPAASALELSPYFHALNRGKLSISLDLASDAGRAVLGRLAARADMILENLSPGVMDRFGIAPDRVHATNPSCIYLSLRGYPEHESTAGLRAYAPVLSSLAGIESLIGYPGEPPTGAMNVAFSDAFASSYGILAALAGIYARRARATGARIVLSQLDAAVFANGRNLVRAQRVSVAAATNGRAAYVEAAEASDLSTSPWLSKDLLFDVRPRGLPELRMARLPWRLDGSLPEPTEAAPELGRDTAAVLSDHLGMAGAEIAELERCGALR